MKLFVTCLLMIVAPIAVAESNVVYLSCPQFRGDRVPDLVVTLDKINNRASMSSKSFHGSGVNYTANAAFGPDSVTWQVDYGNGFSGTVSVNRSTLKISEMSYSRMYGSHTGKESQCTIIHQASNNKF